MEANRDLLQVRSLRYRYGNRTAVDGIDFEIRAGEVFGLLGPNGAGKTTTFSCISGLFSGFEGEMKFRSQPFEPAENPADRLHFGAVPQDLALYENLSARQNLRLFAKLFGIAKSDVESAIEQQLELAGLEDRADDRVSRFSGGMKRRLNLAVGLLHRPPLILLDEPTVGVDPQSRAHLFESLSALRDQGTSIRANSVASIASTRWVRTPST
ncbi:MAG: ABC transporter ATP-binding protein, partial [Planctomycetota bacterium]